MILLTRDVTLFLVFFSPEDNLMDSGNINQCVPGVWLGRVHTDVPLLQDLLGGSCWERPPTMQGRSWDLLRAPVEIWARPEEEVISVVSSIVPGLGSFN